MARDADKLECLVQAIAQQHQGIATVQSLIDNCRAGLRPTLRTVSPIQRWPGQPLAWLSTFQKN